MFGYIGCIKENLDEDQQKQYQSIYCGLCRSLKERYGQMERMCLSYDMAFLILLLSSLYEPEERSGRFRCSVHPLGGRGGDEEQIYRLCGGYDHYFALL